MQAGHGGVLKIIAALKPQKVDGDNTFTK